MGEVAERVETDKEFIKEPITFTVSILLFDNKWQLFLYKPKDEELFKQPGSSYSPAVHKCTPFEKAVDIMRHTLGLVKGIDYDVSAIHSPNSQKKLQSILESSFAREGSDREIINVYREFLENEIVPAPFLITKEFDYKDDKIIDENSYRIDLYYAFNIKDKNKQEDILGIASKKIGVSSGRFFNKFEMTKDISSVRYKDLMYAYNNFMDSINRGKRQPIIRFCTFDNVEDTVCWRVTNKCNSNCSYCLVGDDIELWNPHDDVPMLKSTTIDFVLEKIGGSRINKVIFSGGEPLLLGNLVDVVQKIENLSKINAYSICTNGSFYDHPIFEKIKNTELKKFSKFVISIDGYDHKSYSLQKNRLSFGNVKKFLEKCIAKNINFSVNVLANDLIFENPKSFIQFWYKSGIYNVSISANLNYQHDYNKFKNKLVNHYLDMYSGGFGDISFLRKFELILPECKNNCDMKNIMFIMADGDDINCPERENFGKEVK